MYDSIIIGTGPAGLSAALNLKTYKKDFIWFGSKNLSEKVQKAEKITNYPGFPQISGQELFERFDAHRRAAGIDITEKTVTNIMPAGNGFMVLADNEMYEARTLILCMGVMSAKQLDREDELLGKRLSYCATCDGMFYKDKTVVVAGGGNSGVADALIISRIAKKVILVHRRDTLRATKIYHDLLQETPNIEFCWNSVVTELHHKETLTGIRLKDVHTGEETDLPCDGIFVSVGRKPSTSLFEGQLELDKAGYIAAGETTETSVPGVYAIGDVRTKPLRQVVTAVSDGAAAVHMAEAYLAEAGR